MERVCTAGFYLSGKQTLGIGSPVLGRLPWHAIVLLSPAWVRMRMKSDKHELRKPRLTGFGKIFKEHVYES